MDLCECICRQLQRTMQNAEGILQSISGGDVISHSGGSLAGLPTPNEGLNPATLLTMLFVFLAMMVLFSMRQPRADRGPEKPTADRRRGPEPPAGGAQ